MPGVVVSTAVRTGPSTTTIAPASTFFVVGTAERGPTATARLIQSLSEFETYYGGYSASFTLHQHVRTFFEEGGARCYVARAVGASTSAGTLTLNGAGAIPALQLNAANVGSWSADVSASVTPVGSGSDVRIFFKGSLVFATGEVATAAAAADRINSSALAAPYVTATVLSGALQLLTLATTPLSTGANGSAPTTANHVTALNLFSGDLGAGAVAIPGQSGATAYDGLLAHARANNRIALCAASSAATSNDAISTATAYYTTPGAEHMAFYWPYVTVPGPGGVSLSISPESFVAAKRSVAHTAVGPWQAGAGVISSAKFATGIAVAVDKATGDTLDAARVNALRIVQGSVRVYGARSVSSDETNWRYITFRDLLNHIVVEAERRLEDLVFAPIDGRRTVFGKVEARLVAMLEPMRTAGGLYEAFDSEGNMIDPGYSVSLSAADNPASQLADGLIRASVGVRVSSVGDQIQVTVYKSNLTTSVI